MTYEWTPPEGDLKAAALAAIERLLDDSKTKKDRDDWLTIGALLYKGKQECRDAGKSYPQWCIESQIDAQRFGSKGKGLMYDAPILYEEAVIKKNEELIKFLDDNKTLIQPAHILYQFGLHKKELAKIERKEKREQLRLSAFEIEDDERWRVHHGDMCEWEPQRQYDWIITDPPYPREFLPLWQSLADRAKEFLRPGGLLVAMSGQSYLDEIIRMFPKDSFYWMCAYLTPGLPTPLRQRNVNTSWKPLLVYAPHGDFEGKTFGDVFTSDANDKDHHMWGQSVSGMYDIISKFCLPGESILDPFCGAGTTGVAAKMHGCLFDGVEILEENVEIARVRIYDAAIPESD